MGKTKHSLHFEVRAHEFFDPRDSLLNTTRELILSFGGER